MKDVCFPLTSNESLCKRHMVVDQLKKLVNEVECYDDKPPFCKDVEGKGEKKTDSQLQCFCGTNYPSHNHVMMDGQLAKPVKSEAGEVVARKRWCPPCIHITPLMNPIHSCYRADRAYGKEGNGMIARNGMPPEESAVECYRTSSMQVGTEGSVQKKNSIEEEVFGGQNCPHEHPAPTRRNYFCPEGDPCHIHWSPPYSLQCRYPNTCVASCFHHPAVNDWIYRKPKYRSYLQNVNDKPFKEGF